jgi:integrase
MRKTLTKTVLEMRAPAADRIEIRDSESPLLFRVTANGERSLSVRTRINGEQVRLTYRGAATIKNLSEARTWARQTVDACKAGFDPRKEQEASAAASKRAAELAERRAFGKVVAKYLERRLRKEKENRTAAASERLFDVYFLPRWRDLSVLDIGRSDVNDVLDSIYDGKVKFEGETYGGPVMADRALAQLRACFNWWETQDDKFRSPVVRGMARTSAAKLARDRVLSDAELRALWAATAGADTFHGIARALLLTAQRRDEVASMARAEIASDVWTIPAERYKTKRPNVVPMSKAALAVVAAQPPVDNSDLVFTTTGKTPFSGFEKSKARLDEGMLVKLREADAEATLPPWRLHDLRRTAKTLMARAGVRPDISERVLGHVIAGVEGVYDRHSYLDEKRDALERLAAQIDRIVNPPAANVVPMRQGAAS